METRRTSFTPTCTDGMLCSLPGVCFASRWAVKARPYPSGLPWGQHSWRGSARRGKHKGAGSFVTGFSSQADQEKQGRWSWESSRALLQEGVLGEARGLMKVRKLELERRWSTGESELGSATSDRGFSMWEVRVVLKVTLNHLEKQSPLGILSVASSACSSQKFWLIDLRAAPEICVYQSSRWVLGLGNLGKHCS